MSRLIGTEDWSDAAVEQAKDFLLNLVRESEGLSHTFDPTLPERLNDQTYSTSFDRPRLERIEIITELVELLLVTDRTQQALEVMSDPSLALFGKNAIDASLDNVLVGPSEFLRLAIFAALAHAGGFRISRRDLSLYMKSVRIDLGETHGTDNYRIVPGLILAVLASEYDAPVLDLLMTRLHEATSKTLPDIANTLEYELLGLFNAPNAPQGMPHLRFEERNAPTPSVGFSALYSMERRYAIGIEELRRDSYHWDKVQPSGDLIDWTLLLIQVIAARRAQVRFNIPALTNADLSPGQFLSELTFELI